MSSPRYVMYGDSRHGSIGKLSVYRTDRPFAKNPAYKVEYNYGRDVKVDPILSTQYHANPSDFITITAEEYKEYTDCRIDSKKQDEVRLKIRARIEKRDLKDLRKEEKMIAAIPDGKCKVVNCQSSKRQPPCALCYE